MRDPKIVRIKSSQITVRTAKITDRAFIISAISQVITYRL